MTKCKASDKTLLRRKSAAWSLNQNGWER